MNDGIEKKVLQELASRELMKRDELVNFLQGKVENAKSAAEDMMRQLIFKGFATNLTPVGESCIIITQKGMRAVRE